MITTKKIYVKDIPPELYQRLRRWNFRENGRMQNLYSDARTGRFSGKHYVILLYNFNVLVGHSLTFFYSDNMADSHFYIGHKYRGRGFGRELMKATIKSSPKKTIHEVETHDARSVHFFNSAKQKFNQKISII